MNGFTLTDFVTESEGGASAVTVVLAVKLVLLVVIGSVTPVGVATVAELDKLVVPVIVPGMVIVMEPPTGKAGIATPVARLAAVIDAGQVALPALVQVIVPTVNPAGSVSFTIAPFAALGPSVLLIDSV